MTSIDLPFRSAGILRRTAAYGVDVVLLYIWIIALYLMSTALDSVVPFHGAMGESYLFRHAVGFLTLSLPVLIWFWKWESGSYGATPGKRLLKIRVESMGDPQTASRRILMRNILKFLPWEWAHTFIHLNPDIFFGGEASMLAWTFGMYAPQVLMLVYASMIALRKDSRAPHDLLAATRVMRVGPSTPSYAGVSLILFILVGFSTPVSAQNTKASEGHHPDASWVWMGIDTGAVAIGTTAAGPGIGLGGSVVVDRWLVGGEGHVSPASEVGVFRLQAGGSSLSFGRVLTRGKAWRLTPQVSTTLEGARMHSGADDPASRIWLLAGTSFRVEWMPRFGPTTPTAAGTVLGFSVGMRSNVASSSWRRGGERVDSMPESRIRPLVLKAYLGFGVW